MGATIVEEGDNLSVLRISGLLKKTELDNVQQTAVRHRESDNPVRLLVIVQDFQGWEKGADWGDMTFFTTYGDLIGKIAIVAAPRWETDLMMFSAAGLRRAAVQFFPEGRLAEARAWLAST